MNKVFLTIASLSSTIIASLASGYDTPANIRDFYQKTYPQTASIETVASTTVDGNSYYIIWGTSKSGGDGPDDTEGAFMVSTDGKITQIDKGLPAALPFYYISDQKVADALVKSFIQYEVTQAGGKEKFQESLLQRPFIAQQLAEAYKAEGFTIGTDTKLLKNVEGEIAQ